jgi:hypothetical protein
MFKKLAILVALLLAAVPVYGQADDDEDTSEVVMRLLEKILEQSESSGSNAVDRTNIVNTAKDRRAARVIRRVLKTRKVTVNFSDTAFSDAMDFLRDVTGLNLVVSKAAKEVVNDSGKKVVLKLKNIRLRSCLIHMLQSIDKELCFGVQHGVLMIATKDEFKARSISLRFYRIGDILKRPQDFPAPPLGLPLKSPKNN